MASVPLSKTRIEGVDVARALASAIMILGHANDSFVSPEHKRTWVYAVIALFQSLPLPAFLVLAGAALVLRVDAAIARGEPAQRVRRSIVQRGLTIVAYGYAISLIFALIDGAHGLDTLLRADVLHVIGLSITALGIFGVGGSGVPDRRRLLIAALVLAIVPIALCPWLSPLGAQVPGPLRFLAALFVDVPPVTIMPFVPLASWAAIGALAALAMRTTKPAGRAGASIGFLVALAIGSVITASIALTGMNAMLAALGGPLSRAHPAVWMNAIDLGSRGVLVLAVGALLSLAIPDRARGPITRLGRGSLIAYVIHLPFVYGRFGESLRGTLDPLRASALGLALIALAWLAIHARDVARDRMR